MNTTKLLQLVEGSRMSESLHTMGPLLTKYALPKIPARDTLEKASRAEVVTSMRLLDFDSAGKNLHKAFNWRRPTFSLTEGVLRCTTPPGLDYTYHYAQLIDTASTLYGLEFPVFRTEPSAGDVYKFVDSIVRPKLDPADLVILGYVERLFEFHESTSTWEIEDGVGYRRVVIGGLQVLLVGFELSYWGDIGGALVEVLADRAVTDWVVYIGKLGTLRSEHAPNTCIATGNSSLIEEEMITWTSRLNTEDAADEVDGIHLLRNQRHVTEPSTIDESKSWLSLMSPYADLVDPEIGRMASAARTRGITFDYLHIVSDNLTGGYAHGLFDEHFGDIKELRRRCLTRIETILERSLLQN